MKGAGQGVDFPGNRHALFLHGLQKCRLRAGRGAVDFVRHQQLAEDRPLQEAKTPPAIGLVFQHLTAQDIGRHQIGRELHPPGIQPHHPAERFHQLGLAQARHTHQQHMPAREQPDQALFHHIGLAIDGRTDGRPYRGQLLAQFFNFLHQECRFLSFSTFTHAG